MPLGKLIFEINLAFILVAHHYASFAVDVLTFFTIHYQLSLTLKKSWITVSIFHTCKYIVIEAEIFAVLLIHTEAKSIALVVMVLLGLQLKLLINYKDSFSLISSLGKEK